MEGCAIEGTGLEFGFQNIEKTGLDTVIVSKVAKK